MNTKSTLMIKALLTLFISTSSIALDRSLHTSNKEKPNCQSMHEMDSSEMDMNDPVTLAMIKQCGKPGIKEHHAQEDEKPTCTVEHAKLGHCWLDESVNQAQGQQSKDSEHDHD
jgi:hypothetical protein